MLNFHKDHRNLVNVSLGVFVFLSIGIAVMPAFEMQKVRPLPTQQDLIEAEQRGLRVYVAENCAACHTHQVRNIAMDEVWGDRPSIPSDYYYSKQRLDVWRQSPSVLGSERTGPDLTNIGQRQPGVDWHLIHLYNPRAVVKESIMPSYTWLFELKTKVEKGDVVVAVPTELKEDTAMQIVATQKALDLVAYLQSLKQIDLGDLQAPEFIPAKDAKPDGGGKTAKVDNLLDGAALYTKNCVACHQTHGKGLPGAFPPLAGSEIVNDENPETMIKIILQGYDARPEYAVMTGFSDLLSDEEIAAIATHERSSWGNDAPTVTAEQVKEIRKMINASK